MAETETDRTEAATPRRIIRAREEGNVAVSRELPAFASLAAAVLALAMLGPSLARQLTAELAGFLAHAGTIDVAGQAHMLFGFALESVLRTVAPIAGAALVAGTATAFLQSGFLFRTAALIPDPSVLSPGRWLRRILSPEGLLEQAKAIAKLVVLGLATWMVLDNVQALARASFVTPGDLVALAGKDIFSELGPVLVALAAFAALDQLWVRLRHVRALRMSREEVRQELKETEGDPQIKSRLRQIRKARAKGRMLGAVKKATVVVTNPTHYAVALVYQRGTQGAPRIVAKGIDALAMRIREIAQENHVPIIANPPLARALYRIDLDAEIPPEHYKAVAELIAYIWRLGAGGSALRATAEGELARGS